MFKKKDAVDQEVVQEKIVEQTPVATEESAKTDEVMPVDGAAAAEVVPFSIKFKKAIKKLWEIMKHSWGWTSIALVSIGLLLYMIITDFFM